MAAFPDLSKAWASWSQDLTRMIFCHVRWINILFPKLFFGNYFTTFTQTKATFRAMSCKLSEVVNDDRSEKHFKIHLGGLVVVNFHLDENMPILQTKLSLAKTTCRLTFKTETSKEENLQLSAHACCEQYLVSGNWRCSEGSGNILIMFRLSVFIPINFGHNLIYIIEIKLQKIIFIS